MPKSILQHWECLAQTLTKECGIKTVPFPKDLQAWCICRNHFGRSLALCVFRGYVVPSMRASTGFACFCRPHSESSAI